MTDSSTRPALTFDGSPVPFRDGQTVGGALMAAGISSWRTTRRGGAPRGLFCGIGVCYDCLVTVDGDHAQRACVTPARAGQVVESADPHTPVSERVRRDG
ncbi:(2Fe-2S)-binding protein [Microbacterium excoecariae]|uniref:(2Fe-2S)-binding protein n=1 Tax=Microbacterium excoecariae TaxID=2715210 RepID=UPI00140CDFB8|nr:(2Fe-2S)-binding protein [Microbacterium excoecariae]NHI15661.1 (2Fe-2S)-binding protein [Microbacterium excoecariae]